MTDYRLGIRYKKVMKYDIAKALTKGPELPIFNAELDTIKTDEIKTYTLTSSSCLIESVIGTNVTCAYDESSKKLTLSNPTGPVSLTFITYYNEDNLCRLYVAGAVAGETSQTYTGSWPNRGTISYIDRYNEPKTINVADIGLHATWPPSSGDKKFWSTLDVKVGCNVVCKNIGLHLVRSQTQYLKFSNTNGSYDEEVLLTKDMVASHTFYNVKIVRDKYQNADIRIQSTR